MNHDSPISIMPDSRGRMQRRSVRTGRYARSRGWAYAELNDGPEGPPPPEMNTPSAVDVTSDSEPPSFRFLTDTSYGPTTDTDGTSNVSSTYNRMDKAPLLTVHGPNGGQEDRNPERGPNGGQDEKPNGNLSDLRAAQAPDPAVKEEPAREAECQTGYPNPYAAERAFQDAQASQDRQRERKPGQNHQY